MKYLYNNLLCLITYNLIKIKIMKYNNKVKLNNNNNVNNMNVKM